MRVSLQGFSWTLGGDIDAGGFFQHLAKKHGEEFDLGDHARLLYTGTTGGYLCGLLVTAKDQRRFCELQNKNGQLQLSFRDLAGESRLADFNFFVVHPETLRGIYQYYHGACSIHQFHGYLRRQYGIACKPEAERPHSKFEYQLLMRQDDFNAMLEELQQIRAFEFDLMTLAANERLFRPVAQIARRVRQRVSFQRKAGISKRISAIVEYVRKARPKNVTVVGTGEDGLPRVVRLLDNPRSFGDADFDDIAGELNLRPDEFTKSRAIQRLVKAVRANNDIFEEQ